MTIVCPNCAFGNIEGAFFCSECGTKLITENGLTTAAIRATGGHDQRPSPPAVTTSGELESSDTILSLHVVRTGQILPMVGREEFTLGRVSEGQSILPDVDLSPYEAYSQGVSRLHATIRVFNNSISIADLGSSNGTRLNDRKLQPHREHPVQHGDMIMLGRFKLQALVRQDD